MIYFLEVENSYQLMKGVGQYSCTCILTKKKKYSVTFQNMLEHMNLFLIFPILHSIPFSFNIV